MTNRLDRWVPEPGKTPTQSHSHVPCRWLKPLRMPGHASQRRWLAETCTCFVQASALRSARRTSGSPPLLGVAGTVMASPAAFRGPALGASTPGARVVDRRASSRSPASPTARAARPGPRGRAPVARAARSRTGALASSPRHRASIGVARRPRGRALRAIDDANEPPGTASSAESSASVLRVAASVADSRWFNTYLHAAVVVFILGFLDAGFSRDWTRIGAITPEVEQRLRDLAGVLGGGTSSPPWPPPRRPRRGGSRWRRRRRRPRSWDSSRSWRCVSRPCRPRRRRRRGGDEKRRERRVRAREGGEGGEKASHTEDEGFQRATLCGARPIFS